MLVAAALIRLTCLSVPAAVLGIGLELPSSLPGMEGAAAGAPHPTFLDLISAILAENVEEVDRLLTVGPEGLMYSSIKTAEGASPLSFATARGNLAVLETFVRHGADVVRRDEHGHDLLWHACAHGQLEVVSWLLSKGVDPVGSEGGIGCFVAACSQGKTSIVKLILDHLVQRRPAQGELCRYIALMTACLMGVPELAALAIAGGVDWRVEAEKVGSPLEVGKRNGHGECVRMIEEAERVYTLCKMRSLAEKRYALTAGVAFLPLKRTRSSTQALKQTVVPKYLEERCRRGAEPPIVEVLGIVDSMQEGGIAARRKRSRAATVAERHQVLQHVVDGLNPDVFTELVAYFD